MRAQTLKRAAAATILVVSAFASAMGQEKVATTTAPKSDEGIVRGVVVSASDKALEVRDAKGAVRRVSVDGTTLVMTDDKDFSVANLPDIELKAKDLAKGDLVEVVVASNDRAGIVTRVSPIEATDTARNQ